MIQLLDIAKTYPNGVHALQHINLQVKPGEIYGIIGKSGAGKSTLIRCVNLLERPSSGKVLIEGEDLTTLFASQLRDIRRKIGMIFQQFNLLNSASVYENAALPLTLTKMPKQKIYDTVMPLLELTGLIERKDHYPAQLSGGQKQRVAIARALANKPKILLCDEATSALDPHTTASILALLKTINRQFGLTILLITHEMEVVKTICERVAVLENGQIVEKASTNELITQPKAPAARELVSSILKQHLPHYLQQKLKSIPTKTSYPVWRIWFHGKASQEPIMAHLIQRLGLEINILQANLEHIQNELIGIMIVEAIADSAKLAAGMSYLTSNGLQVEVVGYVDRIN
ncbi:MAG: metN [Gammaproteobacteria bacterium]|jgi:D-methionine transport system ATP-binding protein|nr:metN [Gammaproteobacteria bacterium]